MPKSKSVKNPKCRTWDSILRSAAIDLGCVLQTLKICIASLPAAPKRIVAIQIASFYYHSYAPETILLASQKSSDLVNAKLNLLPRRSILWNFWKRAVHRSFPAAWWKFPGGEDLGFEMWIGGIRGCCSNRGQTKVNASADRHRESAICSEVFLDDRFRVWCEDRWKEDMRLLVFVTESKASWELLLYAFGKHSGSRITRMIVQMWRWVLSVPIGRSCHRLQGLLLEGLEYSVFLMRWQRPFSWCIFVRTRE